MRFTNLFALTFALALSGGLSGPVQAQTPGGVTVFEGARLIVGDGRTIEAATLVVDGQRITQAGAASEIKAPDGATRVDLKGKTVMPMVINTHTHTGTTPDALTRDLKRYAYYGVSAVMSMGSDPFDILAMRDQPVAGGARYLSAGRGISRPEPGRSNAPFWIESEADGRKAVEELIARKVNLIKVWVDDRDGKYEKVTPAMYGAIIEDAHKQGFRVTAHIFALEDAKGLLRANIDAFAHGVRDRDIDDEFIALVKTRPNLVLNPNLPARGNKSDMSWLKASLPATEYEKLEATNTDDPKQQAAHGIQARNLAKMNAAGVRLVLGTDGNVPWAVHTEMEDMVLAGMTPTQVIVASTKNAAEFLRITDSGTLESGKSADFIVLDADPLDDIKNTRRISAIYLRVAAVDRTKLP